MKSIVPTVALVACLAMPAYAYFPEWPRTQVSTFGTAEHLFSHDFNGDGRTDLVARRTDHTVVVSLAQANRTFAAPVVIYTGAYLTDMAIGDANGDGRDDLVVSDTGTNSLVVLPSNLDATFGTPIVTALTMAPTEIASADFNGDGAIDIALRSYSASLLLVFSNDGAGNFAEAWRTAIDTSVHAVIGGDIDGDGEDDFLVRRTVPGYEYVLYFGNGDATFDPPSTIPASGAPSRIRLADLDEDGDLEIVAAEVPSSVSVIVNNGSRTFAARTSYSTLVGSGSDAIDLIVAEVTGDDHVDVVAVLSSGRRLATLAGYGDGTLSPPEYAPVPWVTQFTTMFPRLLAAGDFTGDGRIDLAVNGSGYLAMFANAAGDGSLSVRAIYPTISSGQVAKYEVRFSMAEGFGLIYPDTPPYPTGTITLMDGNTPVGTGSFEGNVANVEAPSLPVGTLTITASFAGDANYRAFASGGVTQNVVAEATTIALTASSGGADLPYAEGLTLHAQVTSPRPGSAAGTWWLYQDGQRSESYALGDAPYWSFFPEDLGTHEYYVVYDGSATQPPAVSDVFRQNVIKGTSVTTFAIEIENELLRYGQTKEVTVRLRNKQNNQLVPTGTVRLFDGSAVLGTQVAVLSAYEALVTFNLPVLAPGVHHIRAVYEGSAKFNTSASDYQRVTILPAGGFVLDVYATKHDSIPAIVASGYFSLPPQGYYKIYLKVGTNPWALYGSSDTPTANLSFPTPGRVYALRMEAYNASHQLLASSNADAAMLFSFSDDPIAQGLTIRAQQVQETVAATNVLRATAGLAPFTLTGAGAGQTIRLAHLTSLRTAVNEARAALGVTPIAFSNDATAGSMVQARHFQELRDSMQ
jgi:Bacterial Ig-like domain (group 3)/FG-GAP-like repeat